MNLVRVMCSILTRYSQLLIPSDKSGIELAASIISSGNLVAFPTETVYGLGANALDEHAVRKIFKAKGRPLTDPVIVHVTNSISFGDLLELNEQEKAVFDILSANFWPGPLTIIAKASPLVPPTITADTGFVGLRYPAHPLAVALIDACRLPIAAPSANRFAHVSPTKAEHVLADLGEKNVMVLDGDTTDSEGKTCEHGIESTVVKLNSPLKSLQIFRQGAVTQSRLLQSLRKANIDWSVDVISRAVKMSDPSSLSDESPSGNQEIGQEAPGQAITHYSPDVPCIIISKLITDLSVEDISVVRISKDELSSVVVVDFGGQLARLKPDCLAYRDLSSSGNSVEAARNLFDTLRWAESVGGARRVFIADVVDSCTRLDSANSKEIIESQEMSLGLADRVYRAASGTKAALRICDML